jgi:hypothetical protein
MRRFLTVFFCTIIVSQLSAQAKLGDYSMQGIASQEMTQQGLVGAHSSLPINSKVKVTNPQNGREAEITIVERIDPSLSRIIDLSPSAASALQLKAGEQVVITVSAPPRPVTQASAQPEPIIDLLEPVFITQGGKQSSTTEQPARQMPFSGQEPAVKETASGETLKKQENSQVSSDAQFSNGYYPEFTLDDPAIRDALMSGANSGDPEFLAWLMVMTIEAREAREARAAREAREARETREVREDRESRELRMAREDREARELRAAREDREARELRAAREAREAREKREAAAARSIQTAPANVTERTQTSTYQTPANNQPQTNNRPAINLPPTEKQNIDRNQPLNLNMLEPVSSAPQKDSSSLRVSANQSQSIQNQQQTQKPQAGLEPVRPEALQIIPGLPDRYSGKSYKLQIGAYSSKDTAVRTAAILKSSGFHAEVEYSGAIYRVFAAGILSADVYSASVRLGSLGFAQIWVKE